MNKLPAFLASAIVTLLLLFSFYFSFNLLSFSDNKESVVVKRVIDGDTLDLTDGRRIRLANINAPEKNRPEALPAIEYLRLFENSTIQLTIISMDKSGERYVGDLYFESNYINLDMVKQGLASKAWVSDSKSSLFSSAEKEAVSQERGIWKHSEYESCVNLNVKPEQEKVTIKNTCPDFEFAGTWIKDESREIFVFPNSTKPSLFSVSLFSGNGTSNKNIFYWDKQYVWNNDKDTAYYFDKHGLLLGYYSYGY